MESTDDQGHLDCLGDQIAAVLGARESELVPLDGGITNRNFRARFGGREVVVRLPGKETGLLGIDRGAEAEANRTAAAAGVAPPVLAAFADPPCLVTEFIEGEAMAAEDLRAPGAVEKVAEALRRVHDCGPIAATFSAARVVDSYAVRTRQRGQTLPADFDRFRQTAARIEAFMRRVDQADVFCHNDLLPANFIESPGGLRIVDWEYAGMGNRYFDLGNFAVNNDLDEEQEAALLDAYRGAPAAGDEILALRAMRFMSDFREAMWGVLQSSVSDIPFDFAGYAERHFERLAAAESSLDFFGVH
jgi:thiamine kinase-like enzyme